MKTLIRFCLGLSICFEVVVTGAIVWLVAEGHGSRSDPSPFGRAIFGLAPWIIPFGILAVGTIATFVVVGRTWERMGWAEKLLSVVPAVAPLGVFRFMRKSPGLFRSGEMRCEMAAGLKDQ